MSILSKNNRDTLKKGKNFIGYLLANYPSEEKFFEILEKISPLIDILEIGYPTLTPDLDGEIIKNANRKIDINPTRDIQFWEKVRKKTKNPIWIMGYSKDLIETNFYLKLIENKLIDGILIPDLTLKQQQEIKNIFKKNSVDLIYFLENNLINTSQKIFKENSLIYFQLLDGKTGGNLDFNNKNINKCLKNKTSKNYIFGGFGIDSKEKAEKVIQMGFDGVVIGSILIKKINESLKNLELFVQEVHEQIKK